jgi:hypothetical protein
MYSSCAPPSSTVISEVPCSVSTMRGILSLLRELVRVCTEYTVAYLVFFRKGGFYNCLSSVETMCSCRTIPPSVGLIHDQLILK